MGRVVMGQCDFAGADFGHWLFDFQKDLCADFAGGFEGGRRVGRFEI